MSKGCIPNWKYGKGMLYQNSKLSWIREFLVTCNNFTPPIFFNKTDQTGSFAKIQVEIWTRCVLQEKAVNMELNSLPPKSKSNQVLTRQRYKTIKYHLLEGVCKLKLLSASYVLILVTESPALGQYLSMNGGSYWHQRAINPWCCCWSKALVKYSITL